MNLLEIAPTEMDEEELTNVLGRIEVYQHKLAKLKEEVYQELEG